jgi:hypothetical protein
MKKERVLYFFVSFFGLWWLASLWRQFWTGSIVNFVKDNEKIKFMVLIDYDGFLITMVQKNTIDPQSRKIANIRPLTAFCDLRLVPVRLTAEKVAKRQETKNLRQALRDESHFDGLC